MLYLRLSISAAQVGKWIYRLAKKRVYSSNYAHVYVQIAFTRATLICIFDRASQQRRGAVRWTGGVWSASKEVFAHDCPPALAAASACNRMCRNWKEQILAKVEPCRCRWCDMCYKCICYNAGNAFVSGLPTIHANGERCAPESEGKQPDKKSLWWTLWLGKRN